MDSGSVYFLKRWNHFAIAFIFARLPTRFDRNWHSMRIISVWIDSFFLVLKPRTRFSVRMTTSSPQWLPNRSKLVQKFAFENDLKFFECKHVESSEPEVSMRIFIFLHTWYGFYKFGITWMYANYVDQRTHIYHFFLRW